MMRMLSIISFILFSSLANAQTVATEFASFDPIIREAAAHIQSGNSAPQIHAQVQKIVNFYTNGAAEEAARMRGFKQAQRTVSLLLELKDVSEGVKKSAYLAMSKVYNNFRREMLRSKLVSASSLLESDMIRYKQNVQLGRFDTSVRVESSVGLGASANSAADIKKFSLQIIREANTQNLPIEERTNIMRGLYKYGAKFYPNPERFIHDLATHLQDAHKQGAEIIKTATTLEDAQKKLAKAKPEQKAAAQADLERARTQLSSQKMRFESNFGYAFNNPKVESLTPAKALDFLDDTLGKLGETKAQKIVQSVPGDKVGGQRQIFRPATPAISSPMFNFGTPKNPHLVEAPPDPELTRKWAPKELLKNAGHRTANGAAKVYSALGGTPVALAAGIAWAGTYLAMKEDCLNDGSDPICADESRLELDPNENPGLYAGLYTFALTDIKLQNALFKSASGLSQRKDFGYSVLRSAIAFPLALVAQDLSQHIVNLGWICYRAYIKQSDKGNPGLEARCDDLWERFVVSQKIVEWAPQIVSGLVGVGFAGTPFIAARVVAQKIPVTQIKGLQIFTKFNGPAILLGAAELTVTMLVQKYAYKQIIEPYSEYTRGVFSFQERVWNRLPFVSLWTYIFYSPKTFRQYYEYYQQHRHELDVGTAKELKSWGLPSAIYSYFANIDDNGDEIYRAYERVVSKEPRRTFVDFSNNFRAWLKRGFAYLEDHSCEYRFFDIKTDHRPTCIKPNNVLPYLKGYVDALRVWRRGQLGSAQEILDRWTTAHEKIDTYYENTRLVYRELVMQAASMRGKQEVDLHLGIKQLMDQAKAIVDERRAAEEQGKDYELTPAKRQVLGTALLLMSKTNGPEIRLGAAETPTIYERIQASAACGVVLPPTNSITSWMRHPSFKYKEGHYVEFTPPRLVPPPKNPDIDSICSFGFSQPPKNPKAGESNITGGRWIDPDKAEELRSNPNNWKPREGLRDGEYGSLLQYIWMKIPEELLVIENGQPVAFDRWWKLNMDRYAEKLKDDPSPDTRTFWQDQKEVYRFAMNRSLLPVLNKKGYAYCQTGEGKIADSWNTAKLDDNTPECQLDNSATFLNDKPFVHRLPVSVTGSMREEFRVLVEALVATYEVYIRNGLEGNTNTVSVKIHDGYTGKLLHEGEPVELQNLKDERGLLAGAKIHDGQTGQILYQGEPVPPSTADQKIAEFRTAADEALKAFDELINYSVNFGVDANGSVRQSSFSVVMAKGVDPIAKMGRMLGIDFIKMAELTKDKVEDQDLASAIDEDGKYFSIEEQRRKQMHLVTKIIIDELRDIRGNVKRFRGLLIGPTRMGFPQDQVFEVDPRLMEAPTNVIPYWWNRIWDNFEMSFPKG